MLRGGSRRGWGDSGSRRSTPLTAVVASEQRNTAPSLTRTRNRKSSGKRRRRPVTQKRSKGHTHAVTRRSSTPHVLRTNKSLTVQQQHALLRPARVWVRHHPLPDIALLAMCTERLASLAVPLSFPHGDTERDRSRNGGSEAAKGSASLLHAQATSPQRRARQGKLAGKGQDRDLHLRTANTRHRNGGDEAREARRQRDGNTWRLQARGKGAQMGPSDANVGGGRKS